jgi:hypothetical protein
MGWYRLYFLGRHDDIRNVDEFSADADEQALMLADRPHDAVSDLYQGYEFWQNSRRVYRYANSGSPRPFVRHVITAQMQASLLRREEVLLTSASAFARSRRLPERMREVREIVHEPVKRSLSASTRSA